MTHILTALSFLLLAVVASGNAVVMWIQVIVYGLTALLWILTGVGVAVPTLPAQRQP